MNKSQCFLHLRNKQYNYSVNNNWKVTRSPWMIRTVKTLGLPHMRPNTVLSSLKIESKQIMSTVVRYVLQGQQIWALTIRTNNFTLISILFSVLWIGVSNRTNWRLTGRGGWYRFKRVWQVSLYFCPNWINVEIKTALKNTSFLITSQVSVQSWQQFK